MSTYYGFICRECKKRGGFFSRQMWGWGNFDIVDSFKFIVKHIESCGEKSICLDSEHGDLYEFEEENRKEFLDKTKDIFPLSNDWEFMKTKKKDFRKEWTKEELKDL